MNINAETFAALGDPVRLAIVNRLALGTATVQELAQPFAISLPAISRHLKILEQVGLISRSRDAQSRPCQLQLQRMEQIAQWVEHTRGAWLTRLNQLDDYLTAVQNPAAPPRKNRVRKKHQPSSTIKETTHAKPKR